MRKLFILLVAFIFLLGQTSCSKPKHSIRIDNQYNRSVNVNVSAAQFGSVGPGKITSYKNILEGDNELSGDLVGTVSVTGKGSHKWTLILTSSGSFSIKEDR